jgi:hypothetical protein
MPLVGSRKVALLGRGGFSPLDVDGLQLWLRADAGVYQDAAKTTPAVNDGDVVGCWEDQSGNGNDATQATTAKKPVVKLGIVNGKPVVRFDGIDDKLIISSTLNISGAQDRTFFAVCKTSSGTSEPVFSINADSSVAGKRWTVRGASGKLRIEIAGSGYNSALRTTAMSVLAVKLYGSTLGDHILYRNSVSESASGTSTVDTLDTNTQLGSYVSGTAFLNGDIAEILVYNSALSDADRQAIEDYLDNKYNVY